jgi:hypothetical protein
MSDQSVNDYKLQQHFDYVFSTADRAKVIAGNSVIINPTISFPVKKVKFGWSYVISANNIVNYVITSNLVNGDVVGNLAKYSYTDAGGDIWSSDSFKESQTFSFVFKDPKLIGGGITFNFQELVSATVASARLVLHMECLA